MAAKGEIKIRRSSVSLLGLLSVETLVVPGDFHRAKRRELPRTEKCDVLGEAQRSVLRAPLYFQNCTISIVFQRIQSFYKKKSNPKLSIQLECSLNQAKL